MKRIYVAFPGAGKTTLVKMLNSGVNRLDIEGAVDLDIKAPSNFKAHKMPCDMRDGLTKYVKSALNNGLTVCTHIWSFDPDTKYNAPIIVVIPPVICKDAWLRRMILRGDSHDFIQSMSNGWKEWIRGWFEFFKLLKRSGNDVRLVQLNPQFYLADLDVQLDIEYRREQAIKMNSNNADKYSEA